MKLNDPVFVWTAGDIARMVVLFLAALMILSIFGTIIMLWYHRLKTWWNKPTSL